MNMNACIVIPARQGSHRFPGKPLAMLGGQRVLQRTWEIAKAVVGPEQVWVTTDHADIQSYVQRWGGQTLRVDGAFRNGSERVWAAIQQLSHRPSLVINLQGDSVLTPPWVVQQTLEALSNDPSLPMATPAVRLSWAQFDRLAQIKQAGHVSGTLVVFDHRHRALYFSKSMIPCGHRRKEYPSSLEAPLWQHIGLYAFRYSALCQYAAWPPSSLEELEQLEQLRALAYGMTVQVVPVDYQGRTAWSVDSPEDIPYIERIIAEEGELL